MNVKINDVRVIPIRPIKNEYQRDTLVGLATCEIDSKFFVGSIGIYEKEDKSGYRLTYPTKKRGNSSLKIFYPVNEDVAKEMEKIIVEEYIKLMQEDL